MDRQDVCNCTEACQQLRYDTQISYAVLSPTSSNKMQDLLELNDHRAEIKDEFVTLKLRTHHKRLQEFLSAFSSIAETLTEAMDMGVPNKQRQNEWFFHQVKEATEYIIEILLEDIQDVAHHRCNLQQERKETFSRKVIYLNSVIDELAIDIWHKYNFIDQDTSQISSPSGPSLREKFFHVTERVDTAIHILHNINATLLDDSPYDIPGTCFAEIDIMQQSLIAIKHALSHYVGVKDKEKILTDSLGSNFQLLVRNVTEALEMILEVQNVITSCVDKFEAHVTKMCMKYQDFSSDNLPYFNFDSYSNLITEIDKAGFLKQMAIKYRRIISAIENGSMKAAYLTNMCQKDKEYVIKGLEDYLMLMRTEALDPLINYFGTLKTTMSKSYNEVLQYESNQAIENLRWDEKYTQVPQMFIWKKLYVHFSQTLVRGGVDREFNLNVHNFFEFYFLEGPARIRETLDMYFASMERKVNKNSEKMVLLKNKTIHIFDHCIHLSKEYDNVEIIDNFLR